MTVIHQLYNAANGIGKLAFILLVHALAFGLAYLLDAVWHWVGNRIDPPDYDTDR